MEKVNEFIAAIDRELAKRDITYPKMLKKLAKKEAGKVEFDEIMCQKTQELLNQCNQLKFARFTLEDLPHCGNESSYTNEIKELVREMDCRLRFYPLMIMQHQISKAEADIEKAIWRELVEYFNQMFTPSIEVKFLKTRCRIINNS